MLAAGRGIGVKEQQALAKFRSSNDITDEMHNDTLKRLGLTRSDFAAMLNSDDTATEDVDICKICFVTKIDTVILPCGHLAICKECGKMLMKHDSTQPRCPICRKPVTRIQEVYRT
eukprot:g2502.t1